MLITSAFAQNPEISRPHHHAGDVLEYRLHVDGPEAEKFRTAYINFALVTEPQKGQETFRKSIGTSWTPVNADGTFHFTLPIQTGTAAGDYVVTVTVAQNNEVGAFSYTAQELHAATLRIEDNSELHKPTVRFTESH